MQPRLAISNFCKEVSKMLKRKRNLAGVGSGLQNRRSSSFGGDGGFDSHSLPPNFNRLSEGAWHFSCAGMEVGCFTNVTRTWCSGALARRLYPIISREGFSVAFAHPMGRDIFIWAAGPSIFQAT